MVKTLVLLDFYLPGYRAGGPVRTVANMVDRIGDHIDFWIVTRDRDLADMTPYPNIVVDSWSQVGNAMVYYSSPGSLSLRNIQWLIKEVSPDVIYLNSFFSKLTIKCLALRWLNGILKVPVILAPRGELSPGALSLKAAKKRLYLALALRGGLYRGLTWHASSSTEQQEIQRVVGGNCDIHIAPNIPAQPVFQKSHSIQKPKKISGEMRLVFFSRISPKKNLRQALNMLLGFQGQVLFDIYGPIEDKHYWEECKNIIAHLPANVHVNYCGSIAPTEVVNMLSRYHFMILPTLGENFGHVILEALVAGCPVLISNQTPWLDLAAEQIGWDLPLDRADRWQNILQHCIDMDETIYTSLSQSAREFALAWIASPYVEQQNVALFMRALRLRQCAASPEL